MSLLSTIINTILSAISQNLTDKIMSAPQDSSRKFARELFSFYEDLSEYTGTARLLATVIEKSEFTSAPIESFKYNYDADLANRTADDLAKIIGRLVSRFCPAIDEDDVHTTEIFQWRPSKRAIRRGVIAEIFDPQLVELTRAAYMIDMGVSAIAGQIARFHIDKERREVITFIPDQDGVLPLLPYLGRTHIAYGYRLNQEELPEGVITRTSLAGNPQLVSEITELIHQNIDAVKQLREKVKEVLREHFTMDDLL